MADINLSPYTAESAAIAQRMRMAELLGQQAMQPVEVPQQAGVKFSPYAGLAKMLQGYTSGMMQRKALEQQQGLANRVGTEATDWIANYGGIKGTPNTPEQIYTPGSGDYRDMGMMGKDLQVDSQGQAIQPAQMGVPTRARTQEEQQAYLGQGMRNPLTSAMASALLSKNIENQDFQNILRSAGMGNAPSAPMGGAPSGAPTGGMQPTGGAPMVNAPISNAPTNNLNPNILAMSGNPQAQKLAEFIQKGQPEYGTTPQVLQKADGSLIERVYGKKGEVIERPISATPYEKEPEANRSVTLAIVAAGIDPKSTEGKNMYRNLIAKQTSHPLGTNVKIENKMGEGVAAQIGPMMKDSLDVATGAVKQVDAAKRVIGAIDAGKIIAGPFAGGRVTLAQMGQALGVGGADAKEQLANTRQVIRGLAEMTLQGRSQMKGQGAITESEGLLAERANSGKIEDLTIPEIKQLALASDRAARFAYAEHERKYQEMLKNPTTSSLATYYQGPAMPPAIGTPSEEPPVGAVRRIK
jgi:hypothetical protein